MFVCVIVILTKVNLMEIEAKLMLNRNNLEENSTIVLEVGKPYG